MLVESDPQKRREWIAALDTIEALNQSADQRSKEHPQRQSVDHGRSVYLTCPYQEFSPRCCVRG
jgi:hypothetical protein